MAALWTMRRPKKSPGGDRGLSSVQRLASVVAAEGGQQMQQAQEQIVDADVEADRRHDVVGLAAMDQLAGLIENEPGHEQHEHAGDGQAEGRYVEEYGRQRSEEGHQDAHHEEAAHEAEVLARSEGVGGQSQEDGASAAQGRHDQLASVGNAQVGADDGPQGQSHEASQGEDRGQTPHAVPQLLSQEQQSEIADDRQQQTRMGQVEGNRQPRCGRAEEQRHGQQRVGIAYDLVGSKNRTGRPADAGIDWIHRWSCPLVENLTGKI